MGRCHEGLRIRFVLQLTRYGAFRAFVHLFAFSCLFAAKPAMARDLIVVAFGDSLTAGYGLKPDEGFAPRLEAALRASKMPARVHNAGVSGDTSASGRARLGWVLNAIKAKPDLVILELGGNDMLRGIKPDQTRANLDAIMNELKRRGIRIVVAGMLASPNMGQVFGRQFNSLYPALANKHQVPLYPFFMRGVAGNQMLLLKDGIHPNPQGVNTIVRGILPVIRTTLRR
jgi:acyl-CoA thioesterase I